ncbi:Putative phage Mu gpF-like domain protein [Candidatus Trichorickettsia mobilis]|uniref:Phage Mu gpF-like domain protein n=1 Tax=Candidatus Trichorickettsia mobilis TaxID=1346319 RepID=A0ABZ0UTI1_9RICK|nr:phage minor head protein [Candidatus Trichorickettsia mobilis]WPY00278.1 Putative phage Mu gpF-like domain protein [Candidatus Trichorickettsia mobilis]
MAQNLNTIFIIIIDTKDKAYLLAVADQVKNHSNKNNDPGIQIHRNTCEELINSTKSPFYVPPGHPLLPLKPVKVVLGKTVIPLGFSQYSSLFPTNQYLDKPNEDYFIWRTQMDGKVRDAHRAYEGRIFKRSAPPGGSIPGDDFNCRCVAEDVPYNLIVTEQQSIMLNPADDYKKALAYFMRNVNGVYVEF